LVRSLRLITEQQRGQPGAIGRRQRKQRVGERSRCEYSGFDGNCTGFCTALKRGLA
jgi:hypothetical protein